ATLYLGYLGIRRRPTGSLLWPAAVLHFVLTILLARDWWAGRKQIGTWAQMITVGTMTKKLVKEVQMVTKASLGMDSPHVSLVLIGLFAALLGGCAGQAETVTMQQPSGSSQAMTVPKGTFTGAASGAQADALAQAVVEANNNSMKQFDAENGRLDKIQA